MSKFFRDYPNAAYLLLSFCLSIIGFFCIFVINNNTKALDRLTDSIDSINGRVYTNEKNIEVHETRLDKGGL